MRSPVNAARFGAFFSVLAVLGAVETFFAARRWEEPRWKRWAVHLSLAGFNSLFLRLTVAAPLYALAVRVSGARGGVAGWLGLRGGWEILVSCVAYDCFDYWWHRANHRVPFLWRFHRAHHLDTHVDVTTSLRFHPGELLLSAAAKALWIQAWGPSIWAFALSEMEITAAAQFHHTNMLLPGPVESVARLAVMTPRVHASHHTVTQRTRDANYATVLSAWDRLFGTFEEPDEEELLRLGLAAGRRDYLSLRAILGAPLAAGEPASGAAGMVK